MIKQQEFRTKGIILSKLNWKESSLILNVLTETEGLLNVIAQGVRKPKSKMFAQFESGHCVNLILKKSVSAQMYKVVDSSVNVDYIKFYSYPQLLSVQIILEIVNQLQISPDESKEFFELISSFLLYIKTVNSNHIFVVWRCWLRIFTILGYTVELLKCSLCNGIIKSKVFINPDNYTLMCSKCMQGFKDMQMIEVSDKFMMLINQIPKAGIVCKQDNIIDKSIIEVNLFFKNYLNFHLNKVFHYKALELYEEYIK
ncbi:MAG: DNA repair protein RecO [Candidatus Cloacimonetes bacterium]|jgi:DNA repair protein RecO|nr:DNA repair protein RecO [Candidatus Cloacimonadota bacterium]MDD4155160.1 DNA repair protein RecO [Candidatus Cloacimonadota bacterium]